MQKADLNEIRLEINALDEELTRTLVRRMACVRRVAEWKKENGVPVRDARREADIIARVREKVGGEYADSVEKVYRAMFDAACDYEEQVMRQESGEAQ